MRAAALVALAATGAGLGLGVRLAHAPMPAAAAQHASSRGHGPRDVGTPIDPRSAAGAAAAASGYVRNGQTLLDADSAGVEALLASQVSAAALARTVDEARGQLAALRDQLAGATGPVRWRQAVLAVNVESLSPVGASVSVWHVGVLSAPGAAPPQSHWATSRVDLVWERDTWMVAAETVTAGPAPVGAGDAAPVDAAQLESTLAGFVVPEQAAKP